MTRYIVTDRHGRLHRRASKSKEYKFAVVRHYDSPDPNAKVVTWHSTRQLAERASNDYTSRWGRVRLGVEILEVGVEGRSAR